MKTLTGSVGLIRLILRRDRLLMPLWILWLTAVPINFAASFAALYPTATERERFAETSGNNAALVALFGPVYDPSVGGLMAWRVSIVTAIVGLISLLTVIRHTRAEEEAGRRELLGATAVGRHAGLGAALITTAAATGVLGLLVAVGVWAQGLPAAGSFAVGLQIIAAGWIFAAVGAVAAQLTEGAGAARGLAVGVLGLAFLVRMGGDLSDQSGGALGWLGWLSPLGWVLRIQPYAGDRWWILAPVVGLLLLLVALAGLLAARRDAGAGLLPGRPGRAVAAARLRGPFGLAWRLHRSLLAGWTAGFVVFAAVLGGVADGAGELFTDSPELQEIFVRLGGRAALVDAFLAAMMGLYGLIAAGYAVQATLRMRAEEAGLRAEPVLSTAVGRLRWAGSHLLFAALGPAVVLAAAGATTGGIYGLTVGDPAGELPRVLAGALVQLPAVWLLAAIAVALCGLLPRFAALGWVGITVAALAGLLGPALQLDQWLLNLSPFTHLPRIPGAEFSPDPVVWLLGGTAILAAAGLLGLRRRDLPLS